jgi:hypothetical protein
MAAGAIDISLEIMRWIIFLAATTEQFHGTECYPDILSFQNSHFQTGSIMTGPTTDRRVAYILMAPNPALLVHFGFGGKIYSSVTARLNT